MSLLPQFNSPFSRTLNENPKEDEIDYSKFGGVAVNTPAREEVDYSQFGGKKVNEVGNIPADITEKAKTRKAGKGESIWLGLQEAVLGMPAMFELIRKRQAEELESYGIPSLRMGTNPLMPGVMYDQKDTPTIDYLSTFPESEDETARRLRVGTTAIAGGAPFGIPGIIAGLVGSQAGQTIREVYGEDGKAEGGVEGAAMLVDLLSGAGTGIATNLGRQAPRTVNQIPAIFRNSQTGLQRSVTKNIIQGEKQALQNVIDNFGRAQIQGFEQEAANISPNRYTDLVQSSAAGIQQHTNNMFRNAQLATISPLTVTLEQGGSALQQAANATFRTNVIEAERNAYNLARDAAKNLSGTAPETLRQARALRAELIKTAPTPEQNPVITYLNNLIADLEEHVPASKLVDAQGRPLTEATTRPRTRSANDLVELVQNGNNAINYDSQFREQSHRLKPIINTLRGEVGGVLGKNQQASSLYQAANTLHAENADIWGTKLMRDMRFNENPEKIASKLYLASNMRNFKTAIADPNIQGVAERMVIDSLTESGSAKANRATLNNLNPELSVNARNAAQQLIDVKDPLTSSGGRMALMNEVLKDAAQSVNTGKRPEKILNLMQTLKGYTLVRDSLRHSPQSKELFRSFERLFVEDLFNSIRSETGNIDFNKARTIFKNNEMRGVVREIGGDNLLRRFTQLEDFANNFERNIGLYKAPETQGVIRQMISKSKNASFIGLVLRALHLPMEAIAGIGLFSGGVGALKLTFNALKTRLLNNPRAVHALESISRASTIQELSKHLPRLIAEIDKTSEPD